MRDLYRCLDDSAPELLRGIARVWQVDLPDGPPTEVVVSLGDRMLDPGALERVLSTLSPEARSALTGLVAEGGATSGHRFSLRHGAVRRLGPAGLVRECPWEVPASVSEELYYRGLVYRTYGQVEDRYEETLFIPDQFLDLLPPLGKSSPFLPAVLGRAPDCIVSDGRALDEDLFAVLAQLRRVPIAVQIKWESGDSCPEALATADWSLRFSGEAHGERLALLWRMLWRLGLVHQVGDRLQPSPKARAWLRLSDLRRTRALLAAWRDDSIWDELRLVPSIVCEETGWKNDPRIPRQALLATLPELPRTDSGAGEWFSLSGYVSALRRHAPDYVRPDGDFETWIIRDTATGEYLRGVASWDRVDGELARHILTRSLRWLGVVDLDMGDDSPQLRAFRVSEMGLQVLREERSKAPERGGAAPKSQATIDGDGLVTISLEDTLYDRYQLERFAEWRGQSGDARYQITDESVWQSQNAGVKVDQIIAFLTRVAGDDLPPSVMRQLFACRARFGRARIRRSVLLQATDEETMAQIASHSTLSELLGELLSPTVHLVDEANVEELTEQLKELGIWPRLGELGGPEHRPE